MLAVSLVALLALSASTQDSARFGSQPLVLDSVAVERWVDSVVQPAMAGSGVPGAVVVVVQRARVVLNKGYGVADLAASTPVDPNVTLFNTASIGKSFTAIVVEQLVAEGVLDLDEDVNRYLKKGKVSGPKVTLRMLLSHRGGFDDDLTGLLVPFDADIEMSAGELNRRLHPLVRPGIATAYDNQGYGLIGLILRDVTSKPIPQLYRERLFDGAGMTGAVHGRPADGKARLARCYTVQGPGEQRPCEYLLYRDGLMGAGGVAASGADMARYLRLLLNEGTLDGRTVLAPAAFADLINFDHIRFHPGMPGGGRAFTQFEEFRGLEYAHSGHVPGFSSMLKVYVDADVGIFVSFLGGTPPSFDLTVSNVVRSLRELNVREGARPGFEVLNNLTDSFPARFIPADRPRSSESRMMAVDAIDDRLDPFLGSYELATNHSRSFVSRLGGWLGTVRLERADSGRVRLGGIPGLGTYRRVGPLLYENAKGDRIALGPSPIGRLMAVGLSGGVFRQTNGWQSPGWSVPVFLVALLVVLTAVIQLRRGAAPSLRRVARSTLAGFGLLFGGLLAEWQWGVTLAIGRGAILLPALWRLAIHVGAAVLVWRGFEFLRTSDRALGRVARGHGIVIAMAGWAAVVAVVAWRVIGAFPPIWSW